MALHRMRRPAQVGSRSLPPPVVRLQPPKGYFVVKKNTRQTGSKAATAAGKVLSNPKSTKPEKAAAASALAQTPKRK